MLREAPDQFPTRRVLVAAIVLLALLAALIFATVSFRSGTPSDPGLVPTTELHGSGSWTLGATEDTSGVLRPLTPTTDPETFARRVAAGLFDWDTTSATSRNTYVERLVAVGDPSGESTPGLVADIAGYLPNDEAWRQLRSYSTRQRIELDSLSVPTLWEQALAEAGPDGFAPGTTAYTVTGVRHRAGIWESEPVASSHDVAFTVFIVCGPTYPECHLLRLSRLDEPLD
ncbi:hypothetical protein [Nocardioides sp. GXZ039]|uniref:hypothetical protein n=2 Tax=Actinomycetes TaxID=1760 RepID=UPI0030F47728